uniref:Chanoclavine synthase catalase protein n=1 Tax=Claviceps paspali TaxID=40601 RepID=G8GV79_CLAPA|nr:chanoclavine synthase catalase protein [Claviceps paspali]
MTSTASYQTTGSGNSGCPSGRDGQVHCAMDQGHRLLDSLARFNREKMPERAVHARGAGAYGEFEVTEDISDICDIDMLLGIGKKTPCAVRFSTTTLERGSAEAVRDFKGMAVKLFTQQGDWDWVCLNMPVFFIRDPSKFPDLIHAQRNDPRTNLANPARWWEFVCNNHETLHMVMIMFSDFGTMFDYRSMSGYVCHAYKWIKADGTWKYVHWFLSSDQGPNFEEGQRESETPAGDAESATRDLHRSLERGEYPSWTVSVQVVDPEDAPRMAFNILDVTKHWNMGNYPQSIPTVSPRVVGKLTLKRGPDDFAEEMEKLAFSPSNLVPGVEPSEDPVLQARLSAYPDAQRHRLGPQNVDRLPANRSRTNAAAAAAAKPTSQEHAEWVAQTTSADWRKPSEADYMFPREMWQALPRLRSESFQNKVVVNMSESVSQVPPPLRRRVYDTLRLVAGDLAERVEAMTEEMVVTG